MADKMERTATIPATSAKCCNGFRGGQVQPPAPLAGVGLALPANMQDARRQGIRKQSMQVQSNSIEYKWNSKRTKRKVHIIGLNGLTLCKTENNGEASAALLDAKSVEFPVGRTACGICRFFYKKTESATKPHSKFQSRAATNDPQLGDAWFDNWVRSRAFFNSWSWARLRYETIVRRGSVCECCGASRAIGAMIVVDHIKPRSSHPQLALDADNLQVLCSACNKGKGNWDHTDFRLIAKEDGREC